MRDGLKVEELRKQFATGRPAVDGVSFDVGKGEIVVLLGPSGCGKTTTLRCIAGLEHASTGRISIGGRLVSAPGRGIMVPPRLREIGMVFQSYAVWRCGITWLIRCATAECRVSSLTRKFRKCSTWSGLPNSHRGR
jgi:ABC-type Fe3+/spermidine/putrescine transport system ATPase subunit